MTLYPRKEGLLKMQTVITVALLVVSIGLAVAGQLTMKAGMNDITGPDGINRDLQMDDFKHPLTLIGWMFKYGLWAVFGIALYAVSALFWLIVLSRTSLSVAYPMVAAGYVIVVLYSKFVFHENVRPIAWVGLALIVIGVAITAQGLPKKDEPAGLVKAPSASVQNAQLDQTGCSGPALDE